MFLRENSINFCMSPEYPCRIFVLIWKSYSIFNNELTFEIYNVYICALIWLSRVYFPPQVYHPNNSFYMYR